jgi:MFS family permease
MTLLPSKYPAAIRSLRHRNFRLFFGGQLISLIGTWMQSLAQAWLVYRLTGSAAQLGLVSFCGQIPVFLFATIGGSVADRFPRHRIVIATQTSAMILAGILAALTLTGVVQVWEIFVLAFCLGVVNAFDIPARQAFVVEMVGKEDLMNAIAINSSMFNSARILGPAIAGALVAIIGEGWCFFANSVSYLAVIAGLLAMKLTPRRGGAAAARGLLHLAGGFSYAWTTTPIRALLLLMGLISFTGMPYATLMPVFAGSILHGGSKALGLLMSSAGAGALLGALTLALRRGLKGLGRGAGFAAILFGLGLIAFSFSRTMWLSMALLVPVGFGMMTQMASSNTLIQMMVPDHLRGRVMAIYSMMFMGMAPFGALWAGFMAEHIGAPLTVAIGGGASVVGAAYFLMRLPSWRARARELIATQQEATATA